MFVLHVTFEIPGRGSRVVALSTWIYQRIPLHLMSLRKLLGLQFGAFFLRFLNHFYIEYIQYVHDLYQKKDKKCKIKHYAAIKVEK